MVRQNEDSFTLQQGLGSAAGITGRLGVLVELRRGSQQVLTWCLF